MKKNFSLLALSSILFLCVSCQTERLREVRPGQYIVDSNTRPPVQVAFTDSPQEIPKQTVEEFMRDCKGEPDGRLTKFYRISHQSGDALIAVLNNWKSPQGRILNYPQTKTLVITETPDTMKILAEILGKVDSPSPQVRIKVRMVEMRSGTSFEYGFEYTQDRTGLSGALKQLDVKLNPKNYNDSLKTGATPFQGSTFTLATSGKEAGNIDITIRALQESGKGEIISCPDILVTEGQSATLYTGEQLPFQEVQVQGVTVLYSTKFKDVGARLAVTPNFIGNESVTLRVQPEVSSLTGWTDPSQAGGISNPIISTRRCETTVTMRDGEIFVIGGLLEGKTLLTKRSVPILGSIPLLGYLFSSIRHETDYTQLLFLLKVEIVSPEKPSNAPKILEPEPEPKPEQK
jgi:type IV pilus assembly protein PilQ